MVSYLFNLYMNRNEKMNVWGLKDNLETISWQMTVNACKQHYCVAFLDVDQVDLYGWRAQVFLAM